MGERGRGLSRREVAARVGVSERTVRYAVARGDLVAHRCGARVIVWERDLERWVDGFEKVTGGAA